MVTVRLQSHDRAEKGEAEEEEETEKETDWWNVTPDQGTVALDHASQTVRERQQKCTTEESHSYYTDQE